MTSPEEAGEAQLSPEDYADFARDALAALPDADHPPSVVDLVDLLSNLMHWAGREGLSFDAALDQARSHFRREREGQAPDPDGVDFD